MDYSKHAVSDKLWRRKQVHGVQNIVRWSQWNFDMLKKELFNYSVYYYIILDWM